MLVISAVIARRERLAVIKSQSERGGDFIGMHSAWNRSKMVGYKVAFVPFDNGKPAGRLADILTGFIADESKFDAYGRRVGVTVARHGSLLVADDAGGKAWRVSATNSGRKNNRLIATWVHSTQSLK